MKSKPCAIPLSEDIYKVVKQKQIELTTKRNKALTLTEVSNEIVKRGLESMIKDDNPIEPVILVEGKPYNSKSAFELGK